MKSTRVLLLIFGAALAASAQGAKPSVHIVYERQTLQRTELAVNVFSADRTVTGVWVSCPSQFSKNIDKLMRGALSMGHPIVGAILRNAPEQGCTAVKEPYAYGFDNSTGKLVHVGNVN